MMVSVAGSSTAPLPTAQFAALSASVRTRRSIFRAAGVLHAPTEKPSAGLTADVFAGAEATAGGGGAGVVAAAACGRSAPTSIVDRASTAADRHPFRRDTCTK